MAELWTEEAESSRCDTVDENRNYLRKSTPLLLVVIFLSLAYLAGLMYYAQVRPLDPDEGFYISAAKLAGEGKTPYRDFSFHQGALMPYLYGLTWRLYPHSLIAMRFLSAACGGIAVLLWGLCLISVKKLPSKVALATFAVILLNPYWISWNVLTKTFAVANLLMTVAMISLYAAIHSGRARWYFVAGAAIGACASARALYAPLVPFLFLWLFYQDYRAAQAGFRKTLAYLAGAACGLAPMLYSFTTDPGAFVFYNFKYRPLSSPYVTLRHFVHIDGFCLISLGLKLYFVAEVLLAIAGGVSMLKLRKSRGDPYSQQDYLYLQLALGMMVVYVATSLIPFPAWAQYYTSPLVPFSIFFIAEGLRVILRPGAETMVPVGAVALILSLVGIRGELEFSRVPYQQLSSYRKIAQAITANTDPNDVVLSIWPGFVFESGRRYFPGSENHFNYTVAGKLSPEARRRYHLISKYEIIKAVSDRDINLVVYSPYVAYLDSTMSATELHDFRAALDSNYSLVEKIDGIGIYRPRSPVSSPPSPAADKNLPSETKGGS